MTCVDCESAKYTQPHGYPFRWGKANMELNGCQAHVKAVLAVLVEHSRREQEKQEEHGPD